MNTAAASLKATDSLATVLSRPAAPSAALARRADKAEAPAPSQPAQAPGLRDFALRFRVDRDSGEIVVTITDPESGDVLRQIPSEDALRLAKALESIGATFLDDQA